MKLGVYELAEKFGVSHTSVYNWLDQGLPYIRQLRGRRMTIVIDVEMAKRWLEEMRNKNKEE